MQVGPTREEEIDGEADDRDDAGRWDRQVCAAGSPSGDKAMIQAAKAMAMTAVDIILDDALYKEIKKEFGLLIKK